MNVVKKRDLENPPLKEAIFELRWNDAEIPQNEKKESRILAGMFFEKVKDVYPFQDTLEAAQFPVPTEFLQGVVQYRFRTAQNDWPLLQIGPGVLTLNETEKYEWESFKERALSAFKTFNELYSIGESVNFLNLRYLNGFDFDFEKDNVTGFLREGLGLNLEFPHDYFAASGVEADPKNFNIRLRYESNDPDGSVQINIASGQGPDKKSAVIWELGFIARDLDVPDVEDGLEEWLDKVHTKLETIFFSMGDSILK